MKYLPLILLLPLTAFAHDWPYSVIGEWHMSGPIAGGRCAPNNCSPTKLQGKAFAAAHKKYCNWNPSGECAPTLETVEVHTGEYWNNGQFRQEHHWLFRKVPDIHNPGGETLLLIGTHTVPHCPNHGYPANWYW